jgi:hypothetical protein
VVLHRGGVALTGRHSYLTQADRADAALGEQLKRGIQQFLAGWFRTARHAWTLRPSADTACY